MTTETEKVIVEIVAAVLVPIASILATYAIALLNKYLHVKIDDAAITKSKKFEDLIGIAAKTAIHKVEDEYRGSKFEDKAEKSKAKLEAATQYVIDTMAAYGVKMEIDPSRAEAAVRAAVETYLGTYRTWADEEAQEIRDRLAAVEKSVPATGQV